jgi:spore coat protein Z
MSSKKQNHRKKFEEKWMEEFNHGHHQHHEHHEPMDDKPDCHDEHDKDDKDCICSLLKRILKAQEEVEECKCKVSCERSIRQLLSKTDCPPNTIPFTLGCGCDLFFGKAAIYGKNGNFCLISSPFFKIKKVDHHCCAVLELLWPTCKGEPFCGPLNCKDKNSIPCSNFNGFVGTGACITVDLSCFCSISCLKPHMVEKATACQIQDIIKCHKHKD